MKPININYLGTTRLWWLVLLIGILLVIGGFAYWFWPTADDIRDFVRAYIGLRFSAGFSFWPA